MAINIPGDIYTPRSFRNWFKYRKLYVTLITLEFNKVRPRQKNNKFYWLIIIFYLHVYQVQINLSTTAAHWGLISDQLTDHCNKVTQRTILQILIESLKMKSIKFNPNLYENRFTNSVINNRWHKFRIWVCDFMGCLFSS